MLFLKSKYTVFLKNKRKYLMKIKKRNQRAYNSLISNYLLVAGMRIELMTSGL